jgi:FkbM family methyltransferase
VTSEAAALPAAGTIVARNYLPAAAVLARSYLDAHPGAPFTVLVVDAREGELAELAGRVPGAAVIGPEELGSDPAEFLRMATYYTVTELCTAVKPWLLRALLREHETAMYLDPDIRVYAPFAAEVAEHAARHGLVLTPHVLEPMPRDGLRPSEADIMASGVFNLGFAAVSRRAGAFLDFWEVRLRHDAISAPGEQLFTDQRWVDNVPAMFEHHVIRDAGYDVAYWNCYQRPLARDGSGDGDWRVAGVPLRFFHFSGYRPEKPWLISTHFADRPRVLLSEYPRVRELCEDYRRALQAAGYAESLETVPYRWDTLPDGTRLSPSLRRAYRTESLRALRRGDPPPANPFQAPEEFLRWASAPADEAQRVAGSNRWAMSVWTQRPDLRSAFRAPLGADRDAFRRWCATSGVTEGELPAAAVPAPAGAPVRPPVSGPGVNVLGYLTAELGVGELGRLVRRALVDSGLPVATVVEESTVANRTAHPLDGPPGEPVYPVSVLCVNADMTAVTLDLHPQLAGGRYLIGVWSWELEDFPPTMDHAFDLVDEIWTPSVFCRDAIAARTAKPVHAFPVPVPVPAARVADEAGPSTSGPFTVLFAFDHNSVLARKNPLAAIEAFGLAFGDDPDVRLVIKSINGDRHLTDRERVRAAAAGDPRITLLEHYLTAAEIDELYARADCYLSPHRSEGFGLTVAEALARGLPVVATGYSATTELLSADTGWLIPYRLVEVGPGNPPYPADARWAEPDTAAAADALREIRADPRAARQRAERGRVRLREQRTIEQAAAWARDRIEQAARAAAAPPGAAPPDADADGHAAPGPWQQAREALRWRPDAASASRVPLAPALRRAVLRALDHYDHHQRTMLGGVLDGVEHGVGELQAALTARLDDLDEQLRRRTADTDSGLRGLRRRLAGAEQTADAAAATAAGARREATAGRELAARAGADAATARDTVAGLADAAVRRADERMTAYAGEVDRRLAAARESGDALLARLDALDGKLMAMVAERDAGAELAARAGQRRQELLERALRAEAERAAPPSGPPATAVLTDLGPLLLPSDDKVILPWLRSYGSWEVAERELLDALLAPGDTFLDIGAHVGYFTVGGLRRVGPGGSVIAVEPWAPARELLRANVGLNLPEAVARRLRLLPVAAWDADAELSLAVSPSGNTGDNRVGPNGGPGERVAGVALGGLPELGADRGRVAAVKVDAQGRDHRALRGLAGVLRRDRPTVLCEFWPGEIAAQGDDPQAVLAEYQGWGYQLGLLPGAGAGAAGAGDGVRAVSARDALAATGGGPDGFATLVLTPEERS